MSGEVEEIEGGAGLGDGWWREPVVAERLIAYFQQHLVALILLVRQGSQEEFHVFTGFLVERDGLLCWVTAGHCLESLQKVRSGEAEVVFAHWHDNYPREGARSIPTVLGELTWQFGSDEADFGVVWVPPANQEAMRKNPKLKPFTQSSWSRPIDDAEGMYLVGYPTELRKQRLRRVGNQSELTFEAPLVGIPVAELIDPAKRNGSFWDYERCLYGRFDIADDELKSIVGASGGPLIALGRDENGRIWYQLVGVQSVWDSSTHHFRAIPIGGVVAYIDHVHARVRERTPPT